MFPYLAVLMKKVNLRLQTAPGGPELGVKFTILALEGALGSPRRHSAIAAGSVSFAHSVLNRVQILLKHNFSPF